MKAVVTGGGGFLGQAIVERLLAEGHEPTVLGRSDYPELRRLGVRCVRRDVAEPQGLEACFAGQDVVFHAAAKPGVWGPRQEYWRANVAGTDNVIAACRAAGVARLVHTSSPSVVFDGRPHRDAGNDLGYPARYECPYPETKAEAERRVLAANDAGLATIALRPHLVYGPRDPHLLPRLFARARAGRLVMVGDGANEVSLTYVENAAVAHLAAAAALAPGSAGAGRAFFVCDAEPVRLWDWLRRLLERVGLPGPRWRLPLFAARAAGALLETLWSGLSLAGEPPLTRFVATQLALSHSYSLEPARAAFAYAPAVTGAEALERTAAWWRPRLEQSG